MEYDNNYYDDLQFDIVLEELYDMATKEIFEPFIASLDFLIQCVSDKGILYDIPIVSVYDYMQRIEKYLEIVPYNSIYEKHINNFKNCLYKVRNNPSKPDYSKEI